MVLHAATASHRGLPTEDRAKAGIWEGLVCLSAGIEDTNDIISDLVEALAAVPWKGAICRKLSVVKQKEKH